MINVEISPRAATQINRGMLWVFSNEIIKKPADAAPGTWVQFTCSKNVLGTGYFNAHSLIAGRVVGHCDDGDIALLLRRRLRDSFERRRFLMNFGSLRLVFSEADFIPGLIVDWYSGVLVLQSNTAGIDNVLPILEAIIPPLLNEVLGITIKGFVVRGDSSIRRLEGLEAYARVVQGNEAELINGVFKEHDVFYSADFLHGQKTGYFLDQRENRFHLERTIKQEQKKSILDLFCYSGGWGLRAINAGAEHVMFVDQSAQALKSVECGFTLNKFELSKARFIEGDVFDVLPNIDEQFDVVVIDPPAFVKSRKALPQAKKAYEKLLRLSWGKCKRSGIVYFCSCSYHLSQSDFLELAISAVGKENGMAHIVYQGKQATDHPILLSMPETNYLKCIGLKKL